MSFYIMFVAASLSKCSQYWLEIGAPAFIVQWITKGVPLIFKEQPCPFHLNNHVLNEKERTFVQEEIKSLLNCGAIEKCDFIPNFVSPIGCVPKKGGKLRMIVDLRQLNKYCEIPKFSQEDIRCALSLVSSDDYMITCDLKSGFHHVPLDSDYQNYITFCWNGVYYKWKVIPFGLCLSPYYFCKIVRSVIQYFRSQGLRVMAYVDDFLLAATNTDIQNQRDYFLDTLQNLGWHVSWEKSSLDPSQAKRSTEYSCSSRDKNPTRQDQTLKKGYSTGFKQCNYFCQVPSSNRWAVHLNVPSSDSRKTFTSKHIQTSGKKKVLGRQNNYRFGNTKRPELVATRIQRLEWSCSETKCYTRTDFYRRFCHWLGCSSSMYFNISIR